MSPVIKSVKGFESLLLCGVAIEERERKGEVDGLGRAWAYGRDGGRGRVISRFSV